MCGIVLCCTEIPGDDVAQKSVWQILQRGFLHHTEREQHISDDLFVFICGHRVSKCFLT